MWEFLSRKKEPIHTSVEEVDSSHPGLSVEAEPTIEGSAEQAAEKLSAILTQAGGSQVLPPDLTAVHTDAENIAAQAADVASRVTQLVELAQVKGVVYAVEVARKMNDLYVLDAMHDELVDKFYEALKTKGLVQGE